jgi:uncharacterized membrane protein YdjX (TVP38/TMEM64 family)
MIPIPSVFSTPLSPSNSFDVPSNSSSTHSQHHLPTVSERNETIIDMRSSGVDIKLSGIDGEVGDVVLHKEEEDEIDLIVHSRGPTLTRNSIDRSPSQSRRSLSEPPQPVEQLSAWKSLTSKPRPVLLALFKAALLFIFSLVFLIILLKTLLPPIDTLDKPKVKIPKSFDDLKNLNEVLQSYKDRYTWRVAGSFITVYLFLQAFSLPGSMYMSILAGAMWGVSIALPVVCCVSDSPSMYRHLLISLQCVATGALLCYLISSFLGPVVLSSSTKWQNRIKKWQTRIEKQGGNVISYLIVIRIAPLPPHWVVNIICPHLGIGVGIFWLSTFLGIMGVSFIHTQIGTTLDQMTGPGDFHLISVS